MLTTAACRRLRPASGSLERSGHLRLTRLLRETVQRVSRAHSYRYRGDVMCDECGTYEAQGLLISRSIAQNCKHVLAAFTCRLHKVAFICVVRSACASFGSGVRVLDSYSISHAQHHTSFHYDIQHEACACLRERVPTHCHATVHERAASKLCRCA
jgi:hypothetical protein